MKTDNLAILFATLTLSVTAIAAKPVSVSFKDMQLAEDGSEIAVYSVKCSDGKQIDISAWNNRKRWCEGLNHENACYEMQIKTAREVCK